MINAINENIAAINQNTAAMNENTALLEDLLESRGCRAPRETESPIWE